MIFTTKITYIVNYGLEGEEENVFLLRLVAHLDFDLDVGAIFYEKPSHLYETYETRFAFYNSREGRKL